MVIVQPIPASLEMGGQLAFENRVLQHICVGETASIHFSGDRDKDRERERNLKWL